jgi:hypothetical protein
MADNGEAIYKPAFAMLKMLTTVYPMNNLNCTSPVAFVTKQLHQSEQAALSPLETSTVHKARQEYLAHFAYIIQPAQNAHTLGHPLVNQLEMPKIIKKSMSI